MRCAKCGAENPDDAFFCGECGGQLRSALSQPSGALGFPPGSWVPPPPPPSVLDTPISEQPPEPSGEPPGAVPPQVEGRGAVMPPAAGPLPPGPPPPYAPPPPPFAPPPQPGAAYPYPPAGYAQAGYGYPPPDYNTSGMGEGYPIPPQASGCTFAGCVPFGLFGFFNGSVLWGILGLVLGWSGLGLIYIIYIGIQGRELAWRNRRFAGIQEFVDTMRAWHTGGIVALCVGLLAMVIYMVAMIGMIIFAASQPTTP